MWRLFRLGIKCNLCPESHSHFRIIGTSCVNDEAKEQDDSNTFGSIGNLENYETTYHKQLTLAEAARKEHIKDFVTKVDVPYRPRLELGLNALDNRAKSFENVKNDKGKSRTTGKEKLYKNFEYRESSGKNFSSNVKLKRNDTNKIFEEKNIIFNNKNEELGESNEANSFGTLSQVSKFEFAPEDPEDIEVIPDIPDDLKDTFSKRLSQQNYGRQMLQLCKQRKLKEAIDILEIEMAYHNVKPNEYCFNVLINACGKAGYVKKACNLFYKMKQLGIRPEKFAYTGVFNACGNVSEELREIGLDAANTLRRQIKENGIIISPITYNAMIKAFGRCGDLTTAFEIVDDMLMENHRITTETLNFLLQGCISNKEAGFRHSLMVWRKLKILKLARTIHSYNLLLRCVKECGAGDPALFSQLLEPLHPKKLKAKIDSLPSDSQDSLKLEMKKLLESKSAVTNDIRDHNKEEMCQIINENDKVKVKLEENMELEIVNYEAKAHEDEAQLPDLLDMKFSGRLPVVALASLEKSFDRLALIGGPVGVLKNMVKDRVQPNIATFTFLLESLPPTLESENSLIASMESFNVKPDIIFYNILIKRRSFRMCTEEALDVLNLIRKANLNPDIITYGCLALAAIKPSEGINLLEDMDKIGIRPNCEIFGALLFSSVSSHEFMYTIQLLQRMSKCKVEPNDKILKYLEEARKFARNSLLQKEQTESEKPNRKEKRKQEEMRLFLMEYKKFLKNSTIKNSEHPWAQFGYHHRNSKIIVAS